MRHTLRHLKGVCRHVLARLLPPPKVQAPNLQQIALLSELMSASVAGSSKERAVAFFESALEGAAFLNAKEAAVAAAYYAEREPAWRLALSREAHQVCNIGLPVYAMTAGPLARGLDWSMLSADVHNDVLYQFRPHQFGFLPRLAIAACLGADTLSAVLATLERWIAYVEESGGGADAYDCNLVVVYRLVAVSWAAPFVVSKARNGDQTAALICLRLFQILVADVQFFLKHVGQTVANNHLLADRFGAWFLAVCYPQLCPRPDPRECERRWLTELARQFQADGTNFEQSVHYHEMGCEMALAYLVVALRRGGAVAKHDLMLIARMVRFQAVLANAQGDGFSLGDLTDDPLLPLDADAGRAGGAWRVLYRTLFDRSFPVADGAGLGEERAFWLLASVRNVSCPLPLPEELAPLGALIAFPEAGYIVLHDQTSGQHMFFRTGPRPGMRTFPGHAMSDLLTIYWAVSGRPLLEPAGTYSYAAGDSGRQAGPGPVRSYFRSPAAHNGVVLRGHDPLGVPIGRFRDTDTGTRVATRWQSFDGVLSWAEGELREQGPLNGLQRGVIVIAGQYVLVYDLLPSLPADADFACHWQFAPEADVTVVQNRHATIAVHDASGYLCASNGLADLKIVRGRDDPPAGWVSRRYGQVVPACQLLCRVVSGTRKLAFVFGLTGKEGNASSLEVMESGKDSVVVELRCRQHHDTIVVGGFAGSLARRFDDINVRGQILWLRHEGNRCVEVRALGLQHLSCGTLGIEVAGGKSAETRDGWSAVASEETANGLSGHWRRTT